MASADQVRDLALAFPEAVEAPHFHKTSFRVAGKIFATMDEQGGHVVFMLTPEQQEMLMAAEAGVFTPAAGAWGRRGSTIARLDAIGNETLAHGLTLSWRKAAPRRLWKEPEG